jgi:hypothetical protein
VTVVTLDQAEAEVKSKTAPQSQEFKDCSELIAQARKRQKHGRNWTSRAVSERSIVQTSFDFRLDPKNFSAAFDVPHIASPHSVQVITFNCSRNACFCSPGRNLKNYRIDGSNFSGLSVLEISSRKEIRANHL